MKRIFIWLSTVVLSLFLFACNSSGNGSTQSENSGENTNNGAVAESSLKDVSIVTEDGAFEITQIGYEVNEVYFGDEPVITGCFTFKLKNNTNEFFDGITIDGSVFDANEDTIANGGFTVWDVEAGHSSTIKNVTYDCSWEDFAGIKLKSYNAYSKKTGENKVLDFNVPIVITKDDFQ